MGRERWEQVERLYHGALERGPEERAAFLSEACAGDEELRRDVAGLLSFDDPSASFIEAPALEVAARALASDRLPEEQAPVAPSVSGRLGTYQLLSPLGKGGMGEVQLALDTRLGRKVALKILPEQFTTDPDRLRRFEREARAASGLNHPNIITIHEIGEAEGTHYIVTEHVEGETLRQRMLSAPQKRMKLSEALEIAAQIAAALGAAHEAGIVHRDIKPENVMVRRDGYVKVLDFGIAKLMETSWPALDSRASTAAKVGTESGVVMGTLRYMSPEQARGEKVDARTDIFSLGVLIYEMVAGRAPFAGGTPGEVIAAILRDEPPPLTVYSPDAPQGLSRIIGKALRKERAERYQTAQDLLGDLKGLGQPTGLGKRLGGMTNAARRRFALSAAVALTFAALAGWFSLGRKPALTARDTILLADFDNKTGDAIFDGTLRQWLATQLEQSQTLRVFPEARLQQTLRQMERPVETRVTAEIAREVCERQNLKAFIAGSIALLGSRYVLILEANQGQNSEALGRAQAEAASKEQVLQALTQAATRLYAQLGPSLSSIQPSGRPLQQITTADLRAVKAYSESGRLAAQGRFVEALPFARRATELDPQLDGGYTLLSILSLVAGQPEEAAEYQRKAFQLFEERAARQPDQVSEANKMTSLAWYHRLSTGNQVKSQEYGLLFRHMAPRDAVVHHDLGASYNVSGQFEQAIPLQQEAIRLNSNFAAPYRNLAEALIRLNRFAEARDNLRHALGLKLEFTEYHTQLYQLALIAGDVVGMQEQLAWAKGKPEEYVALDWQTATAALAGQWRQAQEFSRRAINLAALGENRELAARYATEQAVRAAVLGACQSSKLGVAQGITFGRGRIPLARAALALALCGETKQARTLADELTKRFPEDTVSQAIWLPVVRAALALQRGESGNSATQAIEQLQAVARYEAAAEFWPQYLRGQAYLQSKQGAAAAAEFQKILDHRGYAPLSPLSPLAHLGLARAAALTGDTALSHQAYEDFLTMWKEGDADLPILRGAKREYELAAKR